MANLVKHLLKGHCRAPRQGGALARPRAPDRSARRVPRTRRAARSRTRRGRECRGPAGDDGADGAGIGERASPGLPSRFDPAQGPSEVAAPVVAPIGLDPVPTGRGPEEVAVVGVAADFAQLGQIGAQRRQDGDRPVATALRARDDHLSAHPAGDRDARPDVAPAQRQRLPRPTSRIGHQRNQTARLASPSGCDRAPRGTNRRAARSAPAPPRPAPDERAPPAFRRRLLQKADRVPSHTSQARSPRGLAEDAGENRDRLDHGRVADAALFEPILPLDEVLDVDPGECSAAKRGSDMSPVDDRVPLPCLQRQPARGPRLPDVGDEPVQRRTPRRSWSPGPTHTQLRHGLIASLPPPAAAKADFARSAGRAQLSRPGISSSGSSPFARSSFSRST